MDRSVGYVDPIIRTYPYKSLWTNDFYGTQISNCHLVPDEFWIADATVIFTVVELNLVEGHSVMLLNNKREIIYK